MSMCIADDCGREPTARGMCLKHYKRWRRHGDPNATARRPERERFEERVSRMAECWEWTGSRMTSGYGKFNADDRIVLAHRYSYELHIGRIPDGLVVDHLCRNRACVRPDHLEAVTNEENLRRGAGFALRNGMRTACIHGHEYLPENAYIDPQGGLRCRECGRIRDRRRTQQRSA